MVPVTSDVLVQQHQKVERDFLQQMQSNFSRRVYV